VVSGLTEEHFAMVLNDEDISLIGMKWANEAAESEGTWN